MSSQGFNECLWSAGAAGAAKTATAIGTLLAAADAKYTLPANFIDKVGKAFRLRCYGRISSVVTTPGTFRLSLLFGAAVVFDTQAIPLNIVAQTNVPWYLDVMLNCRAIGGTASLMGGGMWLSTAGLLTAAPATGPGPGGFVVPYNAAPTVGATFDSNVSNAFDIQHTQTAATGSVTLEAGTFEALN